jgi:hypothetical protein
MIIRDVPDSSEAATWLTCSPASYPTAERHDGRGDRISAASCALTLPSRSPGDLIRSPTTTVEHQPGRHSCIGAAVPAGQIQVRVSGLPAFDRRLHHAAMDQCARFGTRAFDTAEAPETRPFPPLVDRLAGRVVSEERNRWIEVGSDPDLRRWHVVGHGSFSAGEDDRPHCCAAARTVVVCSRCRFRHCRHRDPRGDRLQQNRAGDSPSRRTTGEGTPRVGAVGVRQHDGR